MQMLGQSPFQDEKSKTAFEGMRAVGKLTEEQPVPLLFEAISTPRFSFVAHLPKKFIRRELTDLQGEAVVFGKVQRIIPKKEKLEVFSLVPAVTQASMLNRQQRRKMAKSAVEQSITEEIKGPAIVLTPVAVYR
jgi:hypothetical protein